MAKFRLLNADEIECRVSTVTTKGVSLLLYKDARCDMNILDETVGADNWTDEFYEAKGTLFCRVGIRIEHADGTLEWVYKGDAGSPSNMESIKGEASDARKRAGFAWGIGRELYTAPFIWIKADQIKWKKDSRGKDVPDARFEVKEIGYDTNRKITHLVITANGKKVYTLDDNAQPEPVKETPKTPAVVVCPKCGQVVTRETLKGKVREPEEILKACGGMCLGCWKEARNEG